MTDSQALVSSSAALVDQENCPALANRITELQNHGVNVADIKKLQTAGICTVEAMQMATKKDICAIRGISDARYQAMITAANKISDKAAGKFKSASQVKLEHMTRYHVSTGSTELDAALGGGFESSSMTEIIGEYRTGKTQICHTLCVTAQLGENAGKVVYIDTEGTFRPDRLALIAERFGVDHSCVLDNVMVARLYNTDQLMETPEQIEAHIDEQQTSFSLLVIDSIMALFRSDFIGRGELSERQQRLGQLLNQFKKLSERHNIAVVYTNMVMSDPGAGMSYVPDPKKAVGGHVLAHASTTRIMLKKGRDNERIAKVIDSPSLPEEEARFLLGDQGVHNE